MMGYLHSPTQAIVVILLVVSFAQSSQVNLDDFSTIAVLPETNPIESTTKKSSCIIEKFEKETLESLNTDDPYPLPKNGRLPKWFYPINYELSLKVFLQNASYLGYVSILVEARNETNKIVLNMIDLVTKNESCKVSTTSNSSESRTISIASQSFDPSLQYYVIQLNETLNPGSFYQIYVEFRGTLNSKLVGFYLSSYKDSDGNKIRVASTQFSPTDARRAFPCFDEPEFKATFDITIERDQNVMSLSNMPIVETKPVHGDNSRFVDRFKRTLKMSTYFVGFLVSDFVNDSSSSDLNNTQFAVWSRKEAIEQATYALSVGPKLLLYLEQYFGVPYPLPKLDMAAIPDFKFNGMENWGLIMYRESAMLFDPQVTTVQSKRRIMQVIAHEIAHMWFGNLVTPKWWSDLWLKEGFANFMGYKAVDAVEPSWRMMDSLVWSTMYSAFSLDALSSSHPINVEVDRTDRISEIFDAISYDKGASIIRMMQHFLTEDVYKEGMQSYVKTLQYKNAVQKDLWDHLNSAWNSSDVVNPERTVEQIMNTWTLQEGFPLVSVQRNGSHIILTQSRFMLENTDHLTTNESSLSNDDDTICNQLNDVKLDSTEAKWWIPISIVEQSSLIFNETQPKLWMDPNEYETMVNATENEWFVLNVQKTGFYRVNYDNETWHLLLDQLLSNHSIIHYLNRAQILDDALNLARAGIINYSIPLQIAKYMVKERDLSAWNIYLKNFDYMHKMAKYTPEVNRFNNYLKELIIPLYNMTGFTDSPNDSYDVASLRILSTRWACKIGYAPCKNETRKLFTSWLRSPKNKTIISSNVKPTVLCHGIRGSSRSEWNKTFQVYLNSNIQTEKADILIALGCSEDNETLTWYIDQSLEPTSGIIKQDAATVFQGVSGSSIGRELAWNKIKKDWRSMVQYFGSGSSALWRIITAPTKSFNTDKWIQELKNFRQSEQEFLGSARQTINRAIEETTLNANWMKSYFSSVLKWLEENSMFTDKLGIFKI